MPITSGHYLQALLVRSKFSLTPLTDYFPSELYILSPVRVSALSFMYYTGRRTSCSLPFPIWVLSQAPDHSAEVSKVGETPYIVLSFYYIMESIYLSI